jgi:DNA polymerase-1
MEDDFKDQIPLLRQIVVELGLPSLAISGYEADDILASLIQKYKSESDLSLCLYSGDKDLKQVLDTNVCIMDPVKDLPYQTADFVAEYGFAPQYIVDYLALLGDQADNVKGVLGIGEKKALRLIAQYHTLENLYQHLEEIDTSEAKFLAKDKETAFASKQLIQLAAVDLSSVQLDALKFTLDYEKFEDILCNQH